MCSSERSELAPQGKVEFTWNLAAAVGPQNSPELAHPESSDSAIKSPTTPEVAALPTVAFLDDSPLARWVWESKLKTKVKVISLAIISIAETKHDSQILPKKVRLEISMHCELKI